MSSRGAHSNRAPGSKLELAILLCGLATAVVSGMIAYRVSGAYGERDRVDSRVRRFLDPATGRLRLLVYDASGDGTFDTWAYMDGERVLRTEIDEDNDGLIDQWEYYGADGIIEKTGLSSKHDGRLDSWRYPDSVGARTDSQAQP